MSKKSSKKRPAKTKDAPVVEEPAPEAVEPAEDAVAVAESAKPETLAESENAVAEESAEEPSDESPVGLDAEVWEEEKPAAAPVSEEAAAEDAGVDVDDLVGSDDEGPVPDAPPEFPLKRVIEAILFASQKPVSVKELQSVLKGSYEADKENPHTAAYAKLKEPALREAMAELTADYEATARSYEVRESAAGWQLVTRPEFFPWLRQLYPENRSARLSAPAMETLAIIAYRQPITRADIEAIRGVAVDGVMQTLLDRSLVKIAGRAEIPGRPLLYETTQFFMEHFGLANLGDLPNAQELRKIALPKAAPPEEPKAAEEKGAGNEAVAEAGETPASEVPVEEGAPPPGSEGDSAESSEAETANLEAEEPREEAAAGEDVPESIEADEPVETEAVESVKEETEESDPEEKHEQ